MYKERMDKSQDNKPKSMKKDLLGKFKPISLLDYWTIIVFALAVIQLFLIVRQIRVFIVFFFPPLMAYIFRQNAKSNSTKFVCTCFLSLIAFGVVVGSYPRLFPNLPSMDERLTQRVNRILAWYLFVYLLFLSSVFPFHIFILNLVKHKRNLNPELSKFTCWLGLIATSFVGPLMIGVCLQIFKLWPIFE